MFTKELTRLLGLLERLVVAAERVAVAAERAAPDETEQERRLAARIRDLEERLELRR